jgi:hypothetical protein
VGGNPVRIVLGWYPPKVPGKIIGEIETIINILAAKK